MTNEERQAAIRALKGRRAPSEAERREARGLPPEHRGNERAAFEDEQPIEQENRGTPYWRKQLAEARR